MKKLLYLFFVLMHPTKKQDIKRLFVSGKMDNARMKYMFCSSLYHLMITCIILAIVIISTELIGSYFFFYDDTLYGDLIHIGYGMMIISLSIVAMVFVGLVTLALINVVEYTREKIVDLIAKHLGVDKDKVLDRRNK